MNNIELLLNYKTQIINHNLRIVKLSQICKNKRDDFYKSPSHLFHINVISSAARGKLKETAHSVILHDLLHHPILLSSFLEEIVGYPADTFTKDDIRYPDQERIDLSLVSPKKSKFLIIENKVNAAEEQPGQIYRYRKLALKQVSSKSNVIILYLNPDNIDPPSLHSRSKDGIGKETDEETVRKEEIIIKNYKYDILNWLKSKERKIGFNEIHLKSALLQYIDYLEEYFQTKDKFKELHDMTHNEIIKMLGLENANSEEKFQMLTSKIRELNELKTDLERVAKEVHCAKIKDELNDRFLGKITFSVFQTSSPEIGFDVIIDGTWVRVSIVQWTDSNYYWRIYGINGFSNSIKNKILDIIKSIFPNPIVSSTDPKWAIYESTNENFWVSQLIQLSNLFLRAENENIKINNYIDNN